MLKKLILVILVLALFANIVSAGDEVAINKMIKDSGGTVKLSAKAYTIDNPIVMKSGVTLLGTPGKTKILLRPGVKWGTFVPMVDGVNLQSVRISGITFDGNSDKQAVNYGLGYHNGIYLKGCSNIEVDHCTFINSKGDGARFKSCSNANVHSNTITRMGHDGIFIVDSKNCIITKNQVTTRTNSGIRNWNSVNVRIAGNSITSQQDGKGGYAGIQIEYSKLFSNPAVEVSDNVLTKTQGPGVQLIAYSAGLNIKKGITVKNNIFLKTGVSTFISDTGGISFKGLKGVTISNNVGDGCYNSFVWVASGGEGAIIKNNIIINTAPHMRLSQTGTGYGISNRAGTKFYVDSNCFYANKNGNLYRVTATKSDLKSPFGRTLYGWFWNGQKWIKK